jgi:hypothetical protein
MGLTRPRTVVLVEGRSDCVAIETLAARLGRDLEREGVRVVGIGGASNIAKCAAQYADHATVLGLCDRNEERLFRRALPADAVFVCTRDLEDELIRGVGEDETEAIIEAAGELASFRRLQKMPFHRGRARRDQLLRFMGSRSGRKERYARLLAQAVPLDRTPPPLAALLVRSGA